MAHAPNAPRFGQCLLTALAVFLIGLKGSVAVRAEDGHSDVDVEAAGAVITQEAGAKDQEASIAEGSGMATLGAEASQDNVDANVAEVESKYRRFLQSQNKTASISEDFRRAGGCRTDKRQALALCPYVSSGAVQPSSCLGEGGMGQVWSVYSTSCVNPFHPQQGAAQFALKIVEPQPGMSPEAFQLEIKKEAVFLEMVKGKGYFMHSYHSMTLYYPHHICYYLTEILSGGDAQGLVGKSISWIDLGIIMNDIIQGVTLLHSKGVVHSDLKPENVFLTEKCGQRGIQCHAKIADMGLACLYPQGRITAADAWLGLCSEKLGGTPPYFSPEVFTHQLRSPALDVWAIGMILYAIMMRGLPPPITQAMSISQTQEQLLTNLGSAIVHTFDIRTDPNYLQICQTGGAGGSGVAAATAIACELLLKTLTKDYRQRPTASTLTFIAARLLHQVGAGPADVQMYLSPDFDESCYNKYVPGQQPH